MLGGVGATVRPNENNAYILGGIMYDHSKASNVEYGNIHASSPFGPRYFLLVFFECKQQTLINLSGCAGKSLRCSHAAVLLWSKMHFGDSDQ